MSINATTLNLGSQNLGSLTAPAQRPQPKPSGQAPEWKDFAASTANTAANNAANTANTAVTDTAQSLRASLSALLLQAQEARPR